MKADCLALVTPQNDTIWVRSPMYSAELAAKAMEELQQAEPTGTLALVKSYTNLNGIEVFVEVMTPWARASLTATADGQPAPAKAVIEIWHDDAPTFGFGGIGDKLTADKFTHCADMLVPYEASDPSDALDACYMATQNIDANWRPGKTGCRSTSVGDVLVLKTADSRQAYAVANTGFKAVEFETGPKAATGIHDLTPPTALAYLKLFNQDDTIGARYNEDDLLQASLAMLVPGFEYPGWSHKSFRETVAQLSRRI